MLAPGWWSANARNQGISSHGNFLVSSYIPVSMQKGLTDYHMHIPSNFWYKAHLSTQLNCCSFRCSWRIVCRRCSSYIFILDLTHDFNGLCRDKCKTKRATLKCWDMVRRILEVLRYVYIVWNVICCGITLRAPLKKFWIYGGLALNR